VSDESGAGVPLYEGGTLRRPVYLDCRYKATVMQMQLY
jgi:hypothetical protein